MICSFHKSSTPVATTLVLAQMTKQPVCLTFELISKLVNTRLKTTKVDSHPVGFPLAEE